MVGWAFLRRSGYSRECLAIVTKRKLKSGDILEALENLFIDRGIPDHIRSDNGADFTAIAVREAAFPKL